MKRALILHTKPTSRWVLRLALACLSIFAALGFGEVCVRFMRLAPQIHPILLETTESAYRRSENAVLSYELKPGYRNRQADFIKTYDRINSHGQRDIERDPFKPWGTRRILILGDSVVEGHGLSRMEDLLHMQLQGLYGEEPIEVLNFGVSGYNTLAEVELLRVKGLDFSPDVVVLVFVRNDFDEFVREAFALKPNRRRPTIVNALFSRSHLARLVFLHTDFMGLRREMQPIEWHKEAMGNQNVAKGLARLKSLAEDHGFETLVAVWPTFKEDEVVDEPFLSVQDDVLAIEALCGIHSIPCFRLSRFFREDHQSEPKAISPRLAYTLGDEMHPSAKGCRVAAEGIFKVLSLEDPQIFLSDPIRLDPWPGQLQGIDRLGRQSGDLSRVYYNQAVDLERKGERSSARALYLQALEQDPLYVDARINLSVLLAYQGDYLSARDHLERAIEQKPSSWGAWYNLGNLDMSQGHVESAEAHYRRAMELQPLTAAPYLALANCLNNQGKEREALSLFRRIYKQFPDHIQGLLAFGDFLASRGLLEDADELYGSIQRLDPGNVQVPPRREALKQAVKNRSYKSED